MKTLMSPIAILLILLVGSACGSHRDPAPLRSYTCKDTNAQHPCSLCPEGYFCTAKDLMQACGGADVFCPLGSFKPTPISDGHYTIGGDVEHASAQQRCEAGSFCIGGVRNVCPKGFYCPTTGLSAPIQCGNATLFCEEGSIMPTIVMAGYFSVGGLNASTRTGQQIAPVGHYALLGIVNECPEGHFGSTEALSNENCSGLCLEGWYCPQASIANRQYACGAENLICPRGSGKPKQVQPGFYTTTDEEPCRPGTYREPPANGSVEVSSIASSRNLGKCIPCPDGYKHISGDDPSLCLDCGPQAKSTPNRVTCKCHQSATEMTRFRLEFDPINAKCFNTTDSTPQPQLYHKQNTQFTKSLEHPCEPGHYCHEGIRYKCPSGRYGSKDLETSKFCEGHCAKGHWCGEGSILPTQNKCGSPDVYCPLGSSTPIYVSEGYYSNDLEPKDTKSSQQICPRGYWCEGGIRHPCEAGSFGDVLGLSHKACNGKCLKGYYCLAASPSRHQYPCGNSTVYCREGSKQPQLVDSGYYSSAENDAITVEVYAGPNSTATMQVLCEKGFYCSNGVKYSCPAGTYGSKTGSSDISDCEPCSAGYYCPSHPGPPTTEETQLPCGSVDLFCPRRSARPMRVDLGHYTINEFAVLKEGGDTHITRTAQVECEPGYHCQNGIKYRCRAGTYGATPRLVSDSCSGLCPRSYFCPENSVKPLPCSPGSYATGGARECTSCDIPPNVPIDIVLSMCRDDRSCCLDVFESVPST